MRSARKEGRERMRSAICVVMIVSFFALGACDVWSGDLKRGVAAVLLGTVQMLLFW